MAKNKSTLFRTGATVMAALFVLLTVFWLVQYNRYHVLYFQEQTQLFRFSEFYFNMYWIKPGGIAGYIGAFFTQFYFYPWFGAIILSLLLVGVYLLFYSICRRNGKIEYLFVALFIPVLLLLMSLVNQHFRLSYLIGLLISLVGFRVYIALRRPVRIIGGFVIFLPVYIVAAGDALLFLLLALIFELFSEKRPYHYLYPFVLTVWAALIPYLAFRFVYTVTPREAFFALTPVDFIDLDKVNMAAWLSIPALYACWRWLADKTHGWQPAVWKLILSATLVAGMCIGSMVFVRDRRAETFVGMAFSIQNNRWEYAVQSGDSYPFSNNLVSYFTNIALAESGVLPYRMFHYDQTGATGLFLEYQEAYFTITYIGEVYYRLGLIQEAEHSAFEAMVGNAKEHNSQTLRRLVSTSIIMRDTALFNKYIRYFEHSLFYRNWAKNQRRYMTAALADPAYVTPGTPAVASCDNFFLNYGMPEIVLIKLLEKNPHHRLAFEYLMAWYMLAKDMDGVKRCMDTCFYRFAYPDIPVHYEEALMLCQQMNPTENLLEQYPVSRHTRERFSNYMQAYKTAQSDRQLITLYQQFGKTYWFYYHFKQSESLKTEDETNRY